MSAQLHISDLCSMSLPSYTELLCPHAGLQHFFLIYPITSKTVFWSGIARYVTHQHAGMSARMAQPERTSCYHLPVPIIFRVIAAFPLATAHPTLSTTSANPQSRGLPRCSIIYYFSNSSLLSIGLC